jgi:parallel beta-helix repeat protein
VALGDETIDFFVGLNVVNYPVQVPVDYTSYDLINDLRAVGDVVSIQRFDRTRGVFQTTVWEEGTSSPGGVEFPIDNEEAYFIYSNDSFSSIFSGDRNCVSISLQAGYNLVGFPCADGSTVWELLDALGEANVDQIKRYDPDTGEMETAYWDTGVKAGDDFPVAHGEGYQVYMVNDAMYSVPTPDPPVNLVGYPGNNLVALAWQPPPGWESQEDFVLSGYNVYRSATAGGPYTKLNSEPLSHPSYSDDSVTNGSAYFYVVTALGVREDESGPSNEVEVTPFTTGPTSLGGTLDQPVYVWTLAKSPYIITSNTNLLSYATLIIEPGVEVRFDGNHSFEIYGSVQAVGTHANPIVFTSNKPSPARGDWSGINIVEDGVTSVFKYCQVRYAANGFDIAWGSPTISYCLLEDCSDRGINLVSTADALIEYCTVQNNTNYGIVVNWDSTATIRNNTLSGNRYGIWVARSAPLVQLNTIESNINYGVWVQLRGNPQLLNNDIFSNGTYGVYLQGNSAFQDNPRPLVSGNSLTSNGNYDLYLWSYGGDTINEVIDATDNWWGTADPRTIGSRIYDYNDNQAQAGVVDYRDFLNSAGGSPVAGNYIIAQQIKTNTSWTKIASPYIVLGRVLVPTGVTLTIEAGAEVQFAGPYYILNSGKLLAMGTESDTILFTSDKATPAQRDWGGIYFYPESDDSSMLSYCTVEYTDTYGIYLSGTSPTIDHCLVQQSYDRGIHLTDGSQATVSTCTIQNNRLYGIVVVGGSNGTLEDNTITGNGNDGIYVESSSPLISGNDIQTNGRYGLYIRYASFPVVFGNTIANNNSYGMYLQGNNSSSLQNPSPVITGNSIFGNRTYDMYTWDFVGDRTGIVIDATGNWWGTADPRSIGARIYDYNSNTGEGPVVDYRSFLAGPGGSPVTGNFLLAQTLAADTTWTAAASPYNVLGRIIVPEGITLTIEAGAELRFTGVYYILVYGKLLAEGTSGSPILFTSEKTTPARGDWGGIYFYDESDDSSTISYATVEYGGGYNLYCAGASPTFDRVTTRESSERGIYLTSQSLPTINQCVFENNANHGLYVDGNSDATVNDSTFTGSTYGIIMVNASPQITGCTVQNNAYGIYVQQDSAPVISGSTVMNNTSYGIYLGGSNNVFTNPRPAINDNSIYSNGSYDLYAYNYGGDKLDIQVDATGNWWGTDNPRTIGARIYDYNDNTNASPVVDYRSFLDGEGGSPVPGSFLIAHRIAGSASWQAADSPYTLLGRAVVTNGAELIIDPGVELKFAGPYYLLVHGKLTSVGTADAWITMTSDRLTPDRGDWQSIIFYEDSDDASEISYTLVEFAQIGIDCRTAGPSINNSAILSCNDKGIQLTAASLPTIEDSWFDNNQNQGVHILEGSDAIVRRNVIAGTTRYDGIYVKDSSPQIEDNVIEENNRYGIYVEINSDPSITGNTIVNNSDWGLYFRGNNNVANNPEPALTGNNIFGNSSYDVYARYYGNPDSVTLAATGNWWGTVDPGAIENRIYHYPDNNGQSPHLDTSGFASESVGIPAIYEVDIDDTIFSPETSPGSEDQVTVAGTITTTADWTVTVRDQDFNLVKVFNGSGTSFNVIWNGQDGGSFVSDGLYRIYITATEGGDTSLLRLLEVEVDNTLPVADIDDSFNGAILEKIIEVLGSADDLHFTEYELEYGEGSSPSSWTRIGSIGANPVLNDILESWLTNDTETDTAYFINGDYTLRLSVRDGAGNTGTDSALITLDNLYISEVTRTPSTINVYQGDSADISFTLNKSATVSLKIYPEWEGVTGALVKEIVQSFGAAGSQTMSWDGTDTSGDTVPDEAYVYVLDVVSGARTDAYLPTGGHIIGGGTGTIDPSYNAFTNDYWQMVYNQYTGAGRVSMQVTPTGQPAFWVFQNRPLEGGNTLIVWDGRGPDGNIIEGSTNVYFAAPTTMRPNYVITTGAAPAIGGQAPFVEVKSDPYLMTCSYGQFTRFLYNVDQDCRVTVKILPPGISDPSSTEAIVLVDDELQTAGDHEIAEWTPADTSDPNDNSFFIEEDGAYTLSIEAKNPATGFSSLWRAVINVRQ